jgi:hypothetical protein
MRAGGMMHEDEARVTEGQEEGATAAAAITAVDVNTFRRPAVAVSARKDNHNPVG